jgi:hypothetical protein
MVDHKHLKNFETRIIENNAQSLNKEFIKTHYKAILQMANPIIVDKKIILNGYQFKLMMHLFNICNHVSYIPSFFIKEIAEMSFYLQNLEVDGFFHELKSAKKTEFLSMYYKIVSVIMKNKHIKPEKKGVFEKIISQKLTENTVKWLIMHFTQPNIHIDSNAKIMLKAITQTKFEFFETFAVNFKKTIFDLITSSQTQEKSYLNKYVFKIIEKCLIKLNSIEKEFMIKLSKISHNIIDLFLKNKNKKLQKLFRRSLRILYILYDRSGNPNSKTITLFKNKFFPLFDFPEDSINKKFIEKTLWDFVEVNFSILKKKVDLIDYYSFFYNMIINEDPEKGGQKFLNDYVASLYFDNYLTCLEKLFKYEMGLSKGQTMEIAYVKLLHNLFNMLYSDSINPGKKQISIEIICRIVRNCANNMKISILEEISFSHMSFFMEDSNCVLLENLINSIIHNVKIPGIYEYFIKYMDILLIHALRGNYSIQTFQNIIFSLFEKIEDQQIFYLTLSYCKKFFLQLQEEESPGNGSIFIDLYKNENKIKQVNGFLKIIAISSHSIPSKISDKNILQEILNIYSTFLMIKIFNFPNIDFSFKMKLNSADKEDQNDFGIYFLIFALNIPALVFNKNSLLTTPVKIELNYNILNKISEKKKLISDEFEDFGDKTRKWIRDLDTISQLYLLGIYTSFIAKYVLLKTYFADYTEEMQRQKEILKEKIDIEKICRVKSSIVNMMDYFTDNSFLYDDDMNELFCKIFDQYLLRYLDLLKNHHNTQFKQKLLSHDLMIGLNYSCFYHEQVRDIAINLIKRYANNFPFLLNEYDIFEYYVTVLGMLVSNSLQPYSFFIKKVTLNTNKEDHINIGNNILELPSEKYFKEQIYIKLSNIFEKCLQKSHIINNNNISYNIANYVNKCTLLVLHSNILERDELNYSINLLQKIYNNIKKVEIPSFLKTTAYLDPKKFEDYLKDNVYKNFDKYISISAIDDISNFTDYAKSTILQIRNKYMGIVEGKVNNLRINYMNDTLFENYRKLFINESQIGSVNSEEEIINSYCYYKIMNDISLKLQKIFQENDIKNINQNIFPIMVELTSFIVFADMNDFKTTFNKDIITDEIINLITCIPIFLANTSSIEAGSFCWEWILYLNKKKLSSLLNNIILSVKYLKLYRSNFLKIGKESIVKSEIFDIEDFSYKKKRDLREQYELTTMKELKNKIKINKRVSSKSLFLTEHFVNMVNEKVLNFKDAEPNDLINSQINLLKFLKECMNEFCKCDIEKLLLIFNVCKLFVDLSIDQRLYNLPLYIYLHFLIFNISIELIDIFQGKMDLFTSKLKKEEILEFKILVYLFGFRYFEFDKKRRMISNVVLLSEIEQTLVNCVEVIIKDRNKKENYDKIKRNNTKVKNKNKLLNKVYTFVYSIEANLRDNPFNNNSFLVYDNIKDLLIYLIESEINNLRYWNSPSTFHNSHKKYTPSSSKLKEEKVKDIFETAFAISNKLSIKLVQRFPWIERKFGSYMNRLGSTIYQKKKLFYHQPHALKYLIEYMMKNGQKELESLTMIKDLIMWMLPSLNYALKYISFNFNNKLVLHKYSMLLLNNANDSAIIFYMPQLIQSIRTETNHIVEKYILKTCKNSSKVAHQFLWSLDVEEISK